VSFRYSPVAGGGVREAAIVSFEAKEGGLPAMPRIRLIREEAESGDRPGRIDVLVETREAIRAQSLSLKFSVSIEDISRVYANGFQSWTESREFSRNERMRGLNPFLKPAARRYRLENYGDYRFARYSGRPGRFHGYTYMYFLREKAGERILELWADLDESHGYTRFVWDWQRGELLVEKDCEGLVLEGGELLLSLKTFSGSENEVFDAYFSYFGDFIDPEPKAGWCSWYNHYSGITEETVRINLEVFRSKGIPLDIFQIDDGWQRALGDWMETDISFPSGMASLAESIRGAGYQAGLWIAPFLVEEKAQVFREHPDWCIRGEKGDPLLIGCNPFQWSGRFYALDPLYPQVGEYLRKVFRTIFEEWGFSFVKLDFLYAAALQPREGMSRGRIMFEALRMLREYTKGRLTLGCGVPIGSAFGRFDYCRIGADAAPVWEDGKLLFAGYRERVSTRNSLRSTIGRHQLSGRAFGNDPDVFILREHNQKMSRQQRRSLFIINQIYGRLLFTSDNPADYDRDTLRLYLSQFPLSRVCIEEADETMVRFRVGEHRYLACHNLRSRKRERELPKGRYYGFEEGFFGGGPLVLDAYQTRLYLQVDEEPYAVAGSSGLLFPGREVYDFRFSGGRVEFSLCEGVMNEGSIFLKVPSTLEKCEVNGSTYPCEEMGDMKLVVIPRGRRE